MEEGKKGGFRTRTCSNINFPAQNWRHGQLRKPRLARTLVRCITQHITYLQVIKVRGHLLPCLNFMHKICTHNNPCQMLTGDGLMVLICLVSTAGHFPRLLVRKLSNCRTSILLTLLHHWVVKKVPWGYRRACLINWLQAWVLICPGIRH